MMENLNKLNTYHWGPNDSTKLQQELMAERVFTSVPIDESFMPFEKDVEMFKSVTESHSKKFIPCKLEFPSKIRSTLSKKQQALCLNSLSLCQMGFNKEHLSRAKQQDLKLYTEWQNTIKAENNTFLQFAQKAWSNKSKRVELMSSPLRQYANKLWKKKVADVFKYSQFYKPYGTSIPLSVVDNKVEVVHLQDVLHLGDVPEFSMPSLLTKCVLNATSIPISEPHTYNSKLPVSQDTNIDELVKNYNIDIVISSSGMQTIMDNSDNYKSSWNVPVIVKQVQQKQVNNDTVLKNIIYIDKTLPKAIPDVHDFRKYCYKKLVKSKLCHFVGISHPNLEERIDDPCYTPPKKKKKACHSNKIHHNVSYAIWKMKVNNEGNHLIKTRTNDKEINFLIRFKVDGCEWLNKTDIRPLVIKPKIEYQLELGANIATKEELIKEWTSLFFRPFSHLYRVRLHFATGEVVSTESVNLQKINFEAMQFYQYKPCNQLHMVYRVFLDLSRLEPGKYLLQQTDKNGPFAQILKEVTESLNQNQIKAYDLHSQYNLKVTKPVKSNRPWCPIDVNYILPIHNVYKRLPGTFQPPLNIIKKKKKKTKNSKKATSVAKS